MTEARRILRHLFDCVMRWLEIAHTVRQNGKIVGHVIYIQGRGGLFTLVEQDAEKEVTSGANSKMTTNAQIVPHSQAK